MNDAAVARRFICRACAHAHAAWAPRCSRPSCLSLDGMVAESPPSSPAARSEPPPEMEPAPEAARPRLVLARAADPDLENPAEELADVRGAAVPIPLSDVPETSYQRDPTELSPLDAVLGGGLVPGSVVLIGGEPGCGKSSLVMQAASGLRLRCLYATGEETIEQAAGNARRINAATSKVYIVAEIDIDTVLAHARSIRAQVVVIDSIQTLACADLGSGAGSPGQMRECAGRLVRFAKTTGTSVLLIGHVTNDGSLAGPKTLKHLVDVVLDLEAGAGCDGNERVLRCAGKNRFGPSNVVGKFELTARGLVPFDADGWDEKL
jgi:DNA repair protein RadA/Sms